MFSRPGVTGWRTIRRNIKDKVDRLTCQWSETDIGVIGQALISFTEGPEGFDHPADLIIETVGDITRGCAKLTSHGGLEAVAALDLEGPILALDEAVGDVLRSKQQAEERAYPIIC